MYSKWIKSGFILAMLLVSMVSLSMAGCPWFIKNDLYTAQCGVLKEVPASKGILANDPAGTKVVNPGSITIDPRYGTISVNADGSFVYDPTVATDLRSGTYVIFNYMANNGFCDARYLGIAKIQVSCKCTPKVEVCDGLDNNCNGKVDENLGTETCGVGACENTVDKCVDGEANICVPLDPSAEICDDGIDNDCDGLTDENDPDCSPLSPECEPASCANFISCNQGGSCGSNGVCASVAEGSGICVDGSTQCGGLTRCVGGTSDCAAGEVCAVNTCCVDPVCVPTSAFCSDSEGPSGSRAMTTTTEGPIVEGKTVGGR